MPLTWGLIWRSKVLSFEKTQINLVFFSLIRTFDLAVEGTFVRENSNKFGFLLTYSYL